MKTQRAIFRCLNKECKHVWARDYQQEGSVYTCSRMEGDKKILFIADGRCPKCERLSTRGKLVQGTLSESHRCGASCFAAIGANCTCSCNGVNHGKVWLVS